MTYHLINIETVFSQKVCNRLRLDLQLSLTLDESVNKLLSELFIQKLIAKFYYFLKCIDGQALVCFQGDNLRLCES